MDERHDRTTTAAERDAAIARRREHEDEARATLAGAVDRAGAALGDLRRKDERP